MVGFAPTRRALAVDPDPGARLVCARPRLVVAADLLPAVVFAVSGHVVWSAALALGAGAVVGGLIGPTVAVRVPHGVLRVAIACCSVALAAYLVVTVD